MSKISVIFPVYNTPENYLRTAINSILNQTYTDFELIIINDASTNNAEEVILSYKDSRIKYHKNPKNLKVIKTLNKGLKLATGEYIARMDSDDISYKTRFEKQVKILEENPEIGLVNAFCYLIPTKRLITPPMEHNDMEYLLKYYANCIVHPLVMFRKSLVEKHNLKYSTNALHIEDYKLWLDMCQYTKFYTIQEPLLLHRVWEESISEKNSWNQYVSAKILIYDYFSKDLKIKNKNTRIAYEKFIKNIPLTLEEYSSLFTLFSQVIAQATKNAGIMSKMHIINDCKMQISKLLKLPL